MFASFLSQFQLFLVVVAAVGIVSYLFVALLKKLKASPGVIAASVVGVVLVVPSLASLINWNTQPHVSPRESGIYVFVEDTKSSDIGVSGAKTPLCVQLLLDEDQPKSVILSVGVMSLPQDFEAAKLMDNGDASCSEYLSEEGGPRIRVYAWGDARPESGEGSQLAPYDKPWIRDKESDSQYFDFDLGRDPLNQFLWTTRSQMFDSKNGFTEVRAPSLSVNDVFVNIKSELDLCQSSCWVSPERSVVEIVPFGSSPFQAIPISSPKVNQVVFADSGESTIVWQSQRFLSNRARNDGPLSLGGSIADPIMKVEDTEITTRLSRYRQMAAFLLGVGTSLLSSLIITAILEFEKKKSRIHGEVPS